MYITDGQMATSSGPVTKHPVALPWYQKLFDKSPTWLKVIIVILAALGAIGFGVLASKSNNF